MRIISDLVSAYNSADKVHVLPFLTRDIAHWVTKMVNIFGLNGDAGPEDKKIGWSGLDFPEEVKPILNNLSKSRDYLRRQARSSEGISESDFQNTLASLQDISSEDLKQAPTFANVWHDFHKDISSLSKSNAPSKSTLELCDRLRDVQLWDLGVYLEDRDGDLPALIRPVTKDLQAARQEKDDRERQKQKAKEDRKRDEAAKIDKGRLSHREMFRTEEFSAWDEEGVPIRDKQGEEVTKSRRKKLQKEWERQKRLHEEWVEKDQNR